MGDFGGRVGGDVALAFEEAKEAFDGVDFSGDGFGGVAFVFERGFEVFDKGVGDILESGDILGRREFNHLFDVFAVGKDGGVGSAFVLEKDDKLLMVVL